MRDTTIARNYAETMFVLAGKANDLPGWGAMLRSVADTMQSNAAFRLFLESPRVPAAKKSAVLGSALKDKMPRLMVRFIQTLVANRRQMLIPAIADSYEDLVDQAEGRMHARVVLAQEPSDEDRSAIAAQLSRVFGKDVTPHITTDAAIMGGIIVHAGDTVLDGSVRKRLMSIRRRMLAER